MRTTLISIIVMIAVLLWIYWARPPQQAQTEPSAQPATMRVEIRPIEAEEPQEEPQEPPQEQPPEPMPTPEEPVTPPAPPEPQVGPARPTASSSTPASPEGGMIPITADYETFLGFQAYVSLMQNVGGAFYVYNTATGKIISQVDPLSGTFSEVDMHKISRMSPRMREISSELSVTRLTRDAAARFSLSPAQVQIIMLLPDRFDQRLMQELRSHLKKQGIPESEVIGAEGIYRRTGSTIVLQIHTLRTTSGEQTVNLTIPL